MSKTPMQKKPLGAALVAVIMGIVSFWWLFLGIMYFFGSWVWLFYAGIPFVWLLGIIYGIMGFIGLGIAGGLNTGLKQAWTVTLILVILYLIFSIPALFNGYGIFGAALSAVVLVILLIPSVRAYYKKETPPATK
jgi:lysylphosphatidylglycerol synthetase-like protein (DUF2156 family)